MILNNTLGPGDQAGNPPQHHLKVLAIAIQHRIRHKRLLIPKSLVGLDEPKLHKHYHRFRIATASPWACQKYNQITSWLGVTSFSDCNFKNYLLKFSTDYDHLRELINRTLAIRGWYGASLEGNWNLDYDHLITTGAD